MSDGSPTYQRLREFLTKTMKTQHVYQPVMLKTLLQNQGSASTRAVAAAFLALDQSQLEYTRIIARRMPGPVLRRDGIVEDGEGRVQACLPRRRSHRRHTIWLRDPACPANSSRNLTVRTRLLSSVIGVGLVIA
jgi:hypothetical protein